MEWQSSQNVLATASMTEAIIKHRPCSILGRSGRCFPNCWFKLPNYSQIKEQELYNANNSSKTA